MITENLTIATESHRQGACTTEFVGFLYKGESMNHSFDVEVAKEYGINCAILLDNIRFWVMKNKANDSNFYDGYYWTFNSVKAYCELFPYLSNHQIITALKKLKDCGLILEGNYNKKGFDKTKWYTITEKGLQVFGDVSFTDNGISFSKNGNTFTENDKCIPKNDKPIPNTDTDTDTYTNSNNIYNNEFDELWKAYPRKEGKKDALRHYIAARKSGTTFEEVKQGIENYKAHLKSNNTSPKYIKMGSSYFNEHLWENEYEVKQDVDIRTDYQGYFQELEKLTNRE